MDENVDDHSMFQYVGDFEQESDFNSCARLYKTTFVYPEHWVMSLFCSSEIGSQQILITNIYDYDFEVDNKSPKIWSV